MAIASHMSRGLREGGLIVLGAIALYLLIALLSYAPTAPGWSRSGPGAGVANVGGVAGAWFADEFLFLFGYLAYCVPVMVGYSAWVIYRGRSSKAGVGNNRELALRAIGFALTIGAGAGLATLFAMTPLALPVNGGGVLGDVVAKGLIKPFNAAGAALFLLALFLTGVTLFTGLSWLWLMDVTGQRSLQGAGWMMGRWQRYRDEQAGQRARIAREQDVELEKKREKIKAHAPLRIEPVIKPFELQPAAGVKVSQISNLAKDLARALSAISVRVVEVIPGKSVIGLEVPNEHRETVRLSELLSSKEYDDAHSPLSIALGKDIGGHPVVVDLQRMPHLLVAGTTGSGKSVGINAMIQSWLYKATAEDVRMILIDPKMLELSVYQGIPHLRAPVVTDMKDAANALRWCVAEMDRRYRLMAALGVRNIAGYNRKIKDAVDAKAPLRAPLFKAQEGQAAPALDHLPYIVVVIDELADMMMLVGKKVDELIARLAQKARAAGIHLVLATQRPSVDVITGLIKANIPTRIAFQVSSRIDSRTILDQQGAEHLLGHGDMLYLAPGTGVPVRVHGAIVSDQEVHKVVGQLKVTGEPNYLDERLNGEGVDSGEGGGSYSGEDGGDAESDALYDQAVQIVTEARRASISGVQRRLKIGYNRAARMIEQMERAGVVGPLQSNGMREVIAPRPVED